MERKNYFSSTTEEITYHEIPAFVMAKARLTSGTLLTQERSEERASAIYFTSPVETYFPP